jgi:predicted transposase YdaD
LKTDKQLFKIFEAMPEWVFELTGLPSPGRSTLRSFTIKALERSADGVIVPEASDRPLTIVEFQFRQDETIYTRTVAEMMALQEAHQMRAVQGVIFFGYNELDPRTAPWTRVVQTYVLPEVLEAFERERPGHPLAAVFKPLLAEDESVLAREAAGYYRAIKGSELPPGCKRTLQEVFVNWLEQRLKGMGKKEIEVMLLGELPDLEETQSGQDLIRIGERRGLEKGRQEGLREGLAEGLERAIRVFLTARHGTVPPAIEEQIAALGADEAERLLQYLPQCQTLDELAQWLASRQR